MALGIAASQPIGLREQFGTMTKPLHPGDAARVGLMSALMSALMAKHGYTASRRALEAPRGLMQVFGSKTDWREVTEKLCASWEIALNTHKPFACGIVIHPSIDGRTLHVFVQHAIGSVEKPMDKVQLRAKFTDQADPVLGGDKSARAWDLAMGVAQCADLRDFFAATTP